MHLEIVKLEKKHYKDWDYFCSQSDDAWFWHTTKWLDYCLSYGRGRFNAENVSFFMKDESGALIAICPLLLEKNLLEGNSSVLEFETAGDYGIVPAFNNDLSDIQREKILKGLFIKVDSLAAEFGVARASFRMTPLSRKRTEFNWLTKWGFFDNSINSQLIDLDLDLEILWKVIRKGHKYDIKRGQKCFQVKIYDQDAITKEIFEQYRFLHHKAAGRVTRPIETFEMMYDWIKDGNGVLVSASKDGNFAGFSYIILYKDSAYYVSASDNPDLERNIPVYHVMQWELIRWLKERRFKKYEIGIQQFSSQIFDFPSEKEINISFFKRGFGGNAQVLYRGEKFYDIGFMKDLLSIRNSMLLERLSG